jgi:hypothetical protein
MTGVRLFRRDDGYKINGEGVDGKSSNNDGMIEMR